MGDSGLDAYPMLYDEEKGNDEEMLAPNEPSDEEESSEEEVVEDEFDAEDDVDAEDDDDTTVEKVYLPNHADEEEKGPLECDESAYEFIHQVKAGYPCLSFDAVKDELGDNRADQFPITMTIVAGTQAERSHNNSLIVMKLSNMAPSKSNSKKDDKTEDDEDEDSDDEDDEDEDIKPLLEVATMHHIGCVNRVKVTNVDGKPLVASWSDMGKVFLWDISHPVNAVNDHHVMTSYVRNNEAPKPIFTFAGHQVEGYSMAWSKLTPGMLATGDCNRNIHLWKPLEGGSWHVDQRMYRGHMSSVEDIQWSPNENNVLASCSTDKTIRIWDMRAPPNKACMLTKEGAHDSDVNVISWNHRDPLILSGGDDGQIKVWDLRTFPNQPAICTFKQHTAPITSVEWHPTDSSVFAVSGSDDQLTLWDLSAERDTDLENPESLSPEVRNLPPQLLFIHQGQKDIKELHWHPQLPGVLISTAQAGLNVFRTWCQNGEQLQ